MNLIKNKLSFLVLLNIFLTVGFWVIFKFNIPSQISFSNSKGIYDLWANYDGPNYLTISKCWYDKSCIASGFSQSLPLEYYPAHLPGYPAIVAIFDTFTSGPWALLLATLLGNIVLTIYFYRLSTLYFDPDKAFWLSLLFSIFPGRLFAAKMVGSPESWFVGSILASIYYYKKDKSFASALFLGLAQSIKTPAIILLAAFAIHGFLNKKLTKVYPYVLISSFTILSIFSLYYQKTGDFFAYFNSGDNRHLLPIPFQVFLSNQTWVQTIWLEDILYIFAISIFAIFYLNQQYKRDISTIFATLFLLALVFVGHRDISRYASPLYPFLFLAFAPVITKQYAKYLFLLLAPAVILYSINYVVGNIAPIADWAPYL